METSVEVVRVEPHASWDCESCGVKTTIAYIAIPEDDVTYGYCADHLGPAVLAALTASPG